MTTEQFDKKLSEIPTEDLISMARKEVSDLCKSRGNSLRMSIPPSIHDTDMVLVEIIRRFEVLSKK